jgi:hypothetical protein
MSDNNVALVKSAFCVREDAGDCCQFTTIQIIVHPVRINGKANVIKNSGEDLRMTSIIGMDLSSKSIAYAKFVDGKPVSCGEIFIEGNNLYDKIKDARAKTQALFDIGILKADTICIEKAVFVNNRSVVIMLANIFGAVMSVLLQNGAKVIETQPLTWQNYIGNPPLTRGEKARLKMDYPGRTASWYSNRGRQIRKLRTLEFARKYFTINTDSDNTGDACGIAFYGAGKIGMKIETVRKPIHVA